MTKHLLSLAINPIGYMLNFLATAACLLGDSEPLWLESFLANACQKYCSRDGIQDDWHPAIPGSWVRFRPSLWRPR